MCELCQQQQLLYQVPAATETRLVSDDRLSGPAAPEEDYSLSPLTASPPARPTQGSSQEEEAQRGVLSVTWGNSCSRIFSILCGHFSTLFEF